MLIYFLRQQCAITDIIFLLHMNKILMDNNYLTTLRAKLDNILSDEVANFGGFGSGNQVPLRQHRPASFTTPYPPSQGAVPRFTQSATFGDDWGILVPIIFIIMGVLIGITICNFVQSDEKEENNSK